ncbi:nocobactin polyketide synthase NbtC [Nocardia thailandica]|uniref:Nocobactin polyketide synthase NbtC n=1 Tax=Nocardia thailandica TaxID=257275 RepID=A0ABW6PJE0_9NOCA
MPGYRLPDGTIPVLLTSDTADGVRAEAAAVLGYLRDHPATTPDRVSDMLFRTRVARRHRALAMVTDTASLVEALTAVRDDRPIASVVRGDGPARGRRIGFVFPGQGSQRPGMGRVYYDRSPEYRAAVDACARIHQDRYGQSQPMHYLLGDEGEYLDVVWEVQPALMFHMYGLAAMWRAAGVEPAATVGHSQGELAAGAVSRVMTLRDAVLAVSHRAQMVEKIVPAGYSMAVLGMNRDECEDLLARHSGWAELAVVNAPSILAISGEEDTIAGMVATATARGQFARQIQVAYPAHTSMVCSMREDFESMLGTEMSGPHFLESEIPCYGGTLGDRITPDLTHREYWYWNLRNRVRFDRAVVAAARDGVDTLIEVAEHPVLQLALQENLALVPDRDIRVLGTSLRTATGLDEFTRNVAAVAVHDLAFRWDAWRTDDTVSLPLRDFPHTIMHPKVLWMAPENVAPAAIPATPAVPAPRRLVESWQRLDKRAMTPPRTIALIDHTGACAEQAEALAAAADRHGATAVLLGADTPPTTFDTAVVLLPPSHETDGAATIPALTDFFAGRGWTRALDVLGPGGDCWLVTVGGETVTGDDPVPGLFHGAVAAGFRSAGVERPDLTLRHLDLDPAAPVAGQSVRVMGALHTAGEAEIALRGGKPHVKRMVPDTGTAPSAETTDLSHVLIVGGTGKLGLRFCAHYAAAGARRITLLSRSGETPEVTAALRTLRRSGTVEVVVTSCDAGDPAAVAALAAELDDIPVGLLVHAAVNYVDAELADITGEMIATATAAKIVGLDTVLAAVPRTPGFRALLCSSTGATLGGRGQILYAVTNRMLDVAARALRADGVDAVSLEWGLWSVAGPLDADGFARVEGAGVYPMAPEAALAAGLTGHWSDALIMSADWSFLREVLEPYGQHTVLAEVPDDPAPTPLAAPEPAAVAPEPAPEPAAAAPAEPAPLAGRILGELHKVMGTDGSEAIDGSIPLVALGLDSLQALDFRKRVKAELNRDLPVAQILGGASLDDVVLLMAQNTN